MNKLPIVLLAVAAAVLSACGGGGGPGAGGGTTVAAGNVMPISVNLGPNGNYANGVFATVTICVPGTSNCQAIPDVLIDTGSYGLRLLDTVVPAGLALPAQSNGSGLTTAECAVFADGFTWGPVLSADIELGDLVAHSVPINVVGRSSYATPPSDCSTGAGQEEDTAAKLGANGILGIGQFQYDCGQACSENAATDAYWNCSTSANACVAITQPLAKQVQNPVALLDSDNNGVLVQLPSISGSGASGASGSVIFGIGTRSNNGLGSAKVIISNTAGEFSTSFNNTTYPNSFIDSGSNGYFFFDNGIPLCPEATGFYCPGSTQSLSATMTGSNNVHVAVSFSVADAETLFTTNNNSDAAFNDLAGTTGSTLDGSFDWGLPFFFGRKVFFAIEDKSTPGGTGPYYAF